MDRGTEVRRNTLRPWIMNKAVYLLVFGMPGMIRSPIPRPWPDTYRRISGTPAQAFDRRTGVLEKANLSSYGYYKCNWLRLDFWRSAPDQPGAEGHNSPFGHSVQYQLD